jgi:hypothetical protein
MCVTSTVTLGPPWQQIHDRMDAVELELASIDRARGLARDARTSSRRRSLGEAVSADDFLGKTAGAFRSQLGSGAQRSGSVQHRGSSAQQDDCSAQQDSWFTSERTAAVACAVPSPPPSQQEPQPGGWGADLFSPERIFSPIGFGGGGAAAGGGAASHALVAAPQTGPGMRGGPLPSNISDSSNPGLLGSLNEAGRQGPPHARAACARTRLCCRAPRAASGGSAQGRAV